MRENLQPFDWVLNALSFFFFELTAVLRLILVVNTVKVLADDLTVFRFRRLFDYGETFRKGPVLQPDERCFSRLGKFSFLGIEAVARRNRSSSPSQLSSKLSCHSLTRTLSKDGLHRGMIRLK